MNVSETPRKLCIARCDDYVSDFIDTIYDQTQDIDNLDPNIFSDSLKKLIINFDEMSRGNLDKLIFRITKAFVGSVKSQCLCHTVMEFYKKIFSIVDLDVSGVDTELFECLSALVTFDFVRDDLLILLLNVTSRMLCFDKLFYKILGVSVESYWEFYNFLCNIEANIYQNNDDKVALIRQVLVKNIYTVLVKTKLCINDIYYRYGHLLSSFYLTNSDDHITVRYITECLNYLVDNKKLSLKNSISGILIVSDDRDVCNIQENLSVLIAKYTNIFMDNKGLNEMQSRSLNSLLVFLLYIIDITGYNHVIKYICIDSDFLLRLFCSYDLDVDTLLNVGNLLKYFIQIDNSQNYISVLTSAALNATMEQKICISDILSFYFIAVHEKLNDIEYVKFIIKNNVISLFLEYLENANHTDQSDSISSNILQTIIMIINTLKNNNSDLTDITRHFKDQIFTTDLSDTNESYSRIKVLLEI